MVDVAGTKLVRIEYVGRHRLTSIASRLEEILPDGYRLEWPRRNFEVEFVVTDPEFKAQIFALFGLDADGMPLPGYDVNDDVDLALLNEAPAEQGPELFIPEGPQVAPDRRIRLDDVRPEGRNAGDAIGFEPFRMPPFVQRMIDLREIERYGR